MRPLLLLISFLFISGILSAQNVTYAYDNAGNRVERSILLRSAPPVSDETVFLEEILLEHTVKIYPNPTKGQFAVEIDNLSSDSSGKINLYDTNGKMIRERKVESGRIEFDLSNYATGIYILRISIDGVNTTWKVIKE